MYVDHFDLKERPFSLIPDPDFLYWTAQHRRAFDLLEMTVRRRAAIALVTGEIGSGKTTLLQRFMADMPAEIAVGLLSNVVGDGADLVRWTLSAFDLDAQDGPAAASLTRLEGFLRDRAQSGGASVLIVDEAQNVSDHGIETLRLLTNLNSGKAPLLTLVLAGQPELRDRLGAPGFRAFTQRMAASCHLTAMTAQETAGYVAHRLAVAEGDPSLFAPNALAAIHERSGGVPRLVNLLCEMCLMAAFGADKDRIDADFAVSTIVELTAGGVVGGLLPCDAGDTARLEAGAISAAPVPSGEAPQAVSRSEGVPRADADAAPAAPPVTARSATPEEVAEGGGARPERPEPPAAAPPAVEKEVKAAEGEARETPAADPLPPADARRRGSPSPRPVRGETEGVTRPAAARRRGRNALLASTAAALVMGFMAVWPVSGRDAALLGVLPRSIMPGLEHPVPPAAQRMRPAAEDPGAADALFRHALELPIDRPEEAALAYARAALRGHDRAAYYLGQIFETGDGVPHDVNNAREWYASAADAHPRAAERAATLRETPAQDLRPLYARSAAGVVELVWTGGRGPYLIELASAPRSRAEWEAASGTPAIRLDLDQAVSHWRVRSADGATSPWHSLEKIAPEAEASLR